MKSIILGKNNKPITRKKKSIPRKRKNPILRKYNEPILRKNNKPIPSSS